MRDETYIGGDCLRPARYTEFKTGACVIVRPALDVDGSPMPRAARWHPKLPDCNIQHMIAPSVESALGPIPVKAMRALMEMQRRRAQRSLAKRPVRR